MVAPLTRGYTEPSAAFMVAVTRTTMDPIRAARRNLVAVQGAARTITVQRMVEAVLMAVLAVAAPGLRQELAVLVNLAERVALAEPMELLEQQVRSQAVAGAHQRAARAEPVQRGNVL